MTSTADDAGNIRHRGTEATRMPSHRLRSAAAPGGLYRIGDAPDLSVIDGREQPFQEAVDGLPIDPASHGHEIVLRIDIDHIGAVADMGKCGGRSTRPALPVGVKKPVHVAVDRLGLGRRACLIDPLIRKQLTIFPLAVTQREVTEAGHVVGIDIHAAAPVPTAGHRLHQAPSSTTQEFSYPNHRQVLEAPIGSMMFSFRTCGSGRRQTLRAASAITLVRVSLFYKRCPACCAGEVPHSAGLSLGRSAQSGLPHSVPSQSLVCRNRLSQVIVRLCGDSNGNSRSGVVSRSDLLVVEGWAWRSIGATYSLTASSTLLIMPRSTAI